MSYKLTIPLGLSNLGSGPDQDVGVPYCRDTDLHWCGHVNADGRRAILHLIVDRLGAAPLGKTEKRPFHHVLLVMGRDVAWQRDQEIKLSHPGGDAREPCSLSCSLNHFVTNL